MTKEELLRELKLKVNTRELNRQDILRELNLVTGIPEGSSEVSLEKERSFSATKILYVLGAAIVIIGVVIFAAQVWEDIGSIGRVSITLGLGFLLTITGSVLLRSRPDENIGSVFHTIGGLLIPGGAIVTLSEMNLDFVAPWPVANTFIAIFVFYFLLNLSHKNAVLTFFTIANGTAAIYLVVNAMIGGPFEGWFGVKDIYQYLTMAIGAGYLLLAYSFRGSWNKHLVGVLYLFGITGFLGAAFSQVFDSELWQLFYFVLVFGCLFLATYLKSSSVLVISTLFLLAHVSYITAEYFADSVGWPVALIILGFIFIGLGYVSIRINKRYIKN